MIKLMKNTFYKEKDTKEKLCKFITNSKKLSMGTKCKEFEEEFSKYQGRKYSVLVNSGSSANLLLIQALLNMKVLKKGDRVGVSNITWATNIMPLIQLGLKPVPLDVSLKNLNVNLVNLKGKKIKCLFMTNLLGFCGDLDKIRNYCIKNKIILLEDNCESLGSILKGRLLGNFGLASTFSFYVGHHLSTIEGGMICTGNKELYDNLVMARAHGWGRNLDEKERNSLMKKYKTDKFYEMYAFYTLGYNLRPTEITGFLGLNQLNYLTETIVKRNKNFLRFEEAVKSNKDIERLDFSNMDYVSNFDYPVIFKNKKTCERYKRRFKDVEIRAIVGGCMTEQPFFKKEKGYPNAKKIHSLGFYIPNNPDLTEKEIKCICDLLK